MKYYTKEWYDLMQKVDFTEDLIPIPDHEYTIFEIEAIYQQQMEEYIQNAEEMYDEPPLDFSKEIEQMEEFDLDFFIRVDEESGEIVEPHSKEEVIEWEKADYEKELEEYNHRPPFNREEAKQEFEERFNVELEALEDTYPSFAVETVDKRLLALGLVPESIYQKLKKLDKEYNQKFNDIEERAEKELSKQRIPNQLKNVFYSFHDAIILNLKQVENDYEMTLLLDGMDKECTLTFKNGEIIENEAKGKETELESSCWLYHELYKNKEDYALHILADEGNERSNNSLKYITLKCKDIEYTEKT